MGKKIKVAPTQRKGAKSSWDNALELPRNHPGVQQRRVGLERFNYVMLRASPFMLGLALVVWILTAMANAGEDPEVAAPVVIDSPTKALAITTTEAWLAGPTSALPNGKFISWNGVSTMDKPALSDTEIEQETEQPTVEIHTMSVAGEDGRLYSTEVQVATLASTGSKVVGDPSLIPVQTNGGGSIGDINPWPTSKQTSVTDGITQAAKTWASSYLSRDPSQLKQTIGDPSADHFYQPLYGASLVSVEVTAVSTMDFDPLDKERVAKTSLARVKVFLNWEGQTFDKSEAPFITFDLLLEKADTATPVVVAWGGPGSAPTLAPFGNAQNRAVIVPEVTAEQKKKADAANTPVPAPTEK